MDAIKKMNSFILKAVVICVFTSMLAIISNYWGENRLLKAQMAAIKTKLDQAEMISEATTTDNRNVVIWGSSVGLDDKFAVQREVWNTEELVWVIK